MPKTDFKVNWHSKKVTDKFEQVMLEAYKILGEECIKEAEPNVPLRTGALRASGKVVVGDLPGTNFSSSGVLAGVDGSVSVLIGADKKTVYVSYTAPYAIIQHERLDFRHAVGGPKWLEKALPVVWGRFQSFIARAKRKIGVE